MRQQVRDGIVGVLAVVVLAVVLAGLAFLRAQLVQPYRFWLGVAYVAIAGVIFAALLLTNYPRERRRHLTAAAVLIGAVALAIMLPGKWFAIFLIGAGAGSLVRALVLKPSNNTLKDEAGAWTGDRRLFSMGCILLGVGELWPGYGAGVLGASLFVVPVLWHNWGPKTKAS